MSTKRVTDKGIAVELICPVCGKEFTRWDGQWAYKQRTLKGMQYYCSYGCMRKEQRKHEKAENKTGDPQRKVKPKVFLTDDQFKEAWTLRESGKTMNDLVDRYGCAKPTLNKAWRRLGLRE